MTKIAINRQFGGFGLSREGLFEISKRKGIEIDFILHHFDMNRNDTDLIAVIEEMGQRAAAKSCTLEIVEIPNGVDWQIEEYDGMEWIAEKHRRWPC
jgi:hypothetical protein